VLIGQKFLQFKHMNLSYIEEFYKFFPNETYLSLQHTKNLENIEKLEIISKFEELKILNFPNYTAHIPIHHLINLIESLKEGNKLENITFSLVSCKDILPLYETLFRKVNLNSFERFNYFEPDINESKLLSAWIEKNSTLQILKLNRKFSFL
jgi:hypothetical protein